jgi:hypothetical protein
LITYLVINTCRVTEVDEFAMNQISTDATLEYSCFSIEPRERVGEPLLGNVPIMLQAIDDM